MIFELCRHPYGLSKLFISWLAFHIFITAFSLVSFSIYFLFSQLMPKFLHFKTLSFNWYKIFCSFLFLFIILIFDISVMKMSAFWLFPLVDLINRYRFIWKDVVRVKFFIFYIYIPILKKRCKVAEDWHPKLIFTFHLYHLCKTK